MTDTPSMQRGSQQAASGQNSTTSPALLLPEALALHQAGRLSDAEQIYRQILIEDPRHFDSLHLLGVISMQRGNIQAAIDQIGSALNVRPGNHVALTNRGAAFQRAKRHGEALESFDKALLACPDYVEALNNRGLTLTEFRRFEEALASHARAIAINPNSAEAYHGRGGALFAMTRHGEALTNYKRAITLRPNYVDAIDGQGVVLHSMERFAEALASFDKALLLRPDNPGTLSNRGAALKGLGRYEEALASFDKLLMRHPDHVEAFINRGMTLAEIGRTDEALDALDRAIALQPGNARALNLRSVILHGMGRFDEALANCDRAIVLRPDYVEALTNRGANLHFLKRFDEATESYRRASAIKPDHAQAQFYESIGRLLRGDFGGFEQYERRWAMSFFHADRRSFAGAKLWLGQSDIAGKTILLHAEQGFGDTMQFCRYAMLVAERGAKVILEVQKPLVALAGTLSGVAHVVARGDPLPGFDQNCPLMSLPLAMGTSVTTIPSQTPYLSPNSDQVTKWRSRLGAKSRPRVGLVWSGNPKYPNDHNRSIALSAILPLFDIEVEFVSLQREMPAADADLLQRRGDISHFGSELADFADTAALIENLDLVISVDTAVAHLSGALAKPVWLLLPFVPDWRWLLDRDDSPWYPTARLFRQDADRSWDAVVPRVADALHDFVAGV